MGDESDPYDGKTLPIRDNVLRVKEDSPFDRRRADCFSEAKTRQAS